jgi:hypothetical protein
LTKATSPGRYDHTMRRWLLSLLLFVAGSLAAACATSQPPEQTSVAVESQAKTALAWFTAINEKNQPLAVAHFAPGDQEMMDWGDGSTSGWPTFSNVHCRALAQAGPQVMCSFRESDPPMWVNQIRSGPSRLCEHRSQAPGSSTATDRGNGRSALGTGRFVPALKRPATGLGFGSERYSDDLPRNELVPGRGAYMAGCPNALDGRRDRHR